LKSRLKSSPPGLPRRPSRGRRPRALLWRLSSTSPSHAAPCTAWRRGAPAGYRAVLGAREYLGGRGCAPEDAKSALEFLSAKGVKTDSGELAYKYAPLEAIVEQVKGFLSKHGFSYSVDQPEAKPGYIKVAFTVKHSFGHSEVTSVALPLGNKTRIMSQTQVEAAALTFAKRYAFCNAFGILTGDEDTDAQPKTAERGNLQGEHAGNHHINGSGHITAKQTGFIKGLLKKTGYTENDLMRKYEVTGISQLASTQASQIIENLQRLPDTSDADREAEAIANDAVAVLS
jgi:ERF superfamily